MKIHILSDLHLEIARWRKPADLNAIDADVTVLAGDIGSGLQGLEFALSIDRPVLYVMGNHEHYSQKHTIHSLLENARAMVAGTHVQILENEAITMDGVRFLGCTLWSDFALFGLSSQVRSMLTSSMQINDYKNIHITRHSRQGQLMVPSDAVEMHKDSRAFIEQALDEDHTMSTVVITHHAPSRQSVQSVDRLTSSQRAIELNDELSGSYASNLEHLVERTDLWIHGHTHRALDYRIGDGRVVSNPRGYGGTAEVKGFDPFMVVEV
ncbi:MAG: metallophosphoesterase [Halothiobacillus sp.]